MSRLQKCVTILAVVFSIPPGVQGQESPAVSYLALGDSYTIGESVPVDQRWPVQLVDSLRNRGIDMSDPKILAKTGWTTDELLEAINKANLTSNYDLVSLLIGVNNQYREFNIEAYQKEFRQLLQQAITFAGGQARRVFVVSIPDYGVTPFGREKNPLKIARELKRYNTITQEICHSHNVTFINITPFSRNAKNDSTLISEDELHPSGKMYQQWISDIIPEILPKLTWARSEKSGIKNLSNSY